jgi:uncharacterized membrane protein YozB (DUF420 family)
MNAPTTATESGTVRTLIALLSVVVVVAVAVVIRLFPSGGPSSGGSVLPAVNASLNATSAVLLVLGYRFIRRKNVRAHRACMLAAFVASSLFLVTYLLHHAQVGSVPFHGHGLVRLVYLAFLIPHVLLAAVIVPLALVTLYRGYTARIEKHRLIARYTLPIWLYVSVSGVIVYLMLYHLPQ